MTRMLSALALALGVLVCSGQSSVQADGALIETTAPLPDRSEESVKAAVKAAIDKAVRRAAAMGFVWLQLWDAQVSGDEVAIQLLATDEEPAQVEERDPGLRPGETEDDEGLREGPSFELTSPSTSRVRI